MSATPSFKTVTRDFWSDIDQAQASAELQETAEEAGAFDIAVAKEAAPKVQDAGNDVTPSTARRPVDAADDGGPFELDDSGHPQAPVEEVATSAALRRLDHVRSRSNDLNKGTPHRTPTATLPNVPTPSNITPRLPEPPHRPDVRRPPRMPLPLDTPAHIESPKDTPRPPGDAGAAPQDTPAPTGSNSLAQFQGKKDHLTLTKTFEAFNKDLARQEARLSKDEEQKKSKTKGKALSKAESANLGGKVLEGLRFCIPPEVGQVSKHKQRWGIVSSTCSRNNVTKLRRSRLQVWADK